MKLGPDTLILSNIGAKNISELYRDYEGGSTLPELLTYDLIDRKLVYKPVLKIIKHEDSELYISKYYDTFMSKMTGVVSSKETEILRYDIINTREEPIVGGSFNVYAYLYRNWKLADPDWQPISELLNHGAIAPNLASGDLVVKFVERKFFASDNGYEIFTGRKEIKTSKKTSEAKIEDIYEEMTVFASQSFQFNYNLVLVR
jgi:hypothetical protein